MNHKKLITNLVICLLCLSSYSFAKDYTYPVIDTGQTTYFDNTSPIPCPAPDAGFAGQDAQYKGNQPTYHDNGDGTVTDGPSNNRIPPPPPPPRGNNQMQNSIPGRGQYGQMGGMGQGQRRGRGMGQGPGGMRQGPPPQAATACVDKSQGDPCSFQTPRRTINGSCLQMDGMGDQLICVPAEHGRGMGGW